MKYYLIPKEEKDLDIISEKWCIGGELEDNKFFKGKAWKIYLELINKSTPKLKLLDFYCVKNNYGKVLKWYSFKKILDKRTLLK